MSLLRYLFKHALHTVDDTVSLWMTLCHCVTVDDTVVAVDDTVVAVDDTVSLWTTLCYLFKHALHTVDDTVVAVDDTVSLCHCGRHCGCCGRHCGCCGRHCVTVDDTVVAVDDTVVDAHSERVCARSQELRLPQTNSGQEQGGHRSRWPAILTQVSAKRYRFSDCTPSRVWAFISSCVNHTSDAVFVCALLKMPKVCVKTIGSTTKYSLN
jgi:hypothetical protein